MLYNPNPEFTLIKENEYAEKITFVHQTLKNHCHSGYFQSFDNCKMHYEYYLTSQSKASVLILHGLSEFTKKYEEMTWYFLNSGYNVFIYDLRGHGYSYHQLEDLQMIHIDQFDDYVKDTDCFVKQIVEPNSVGLPIYIYAHSMGGAIASIYATEYKTPITKMLLSSPLVVPYTGMPYHLTKMLTRYAVNKYGPTHCMNATNRFNPDSPGSRNSYVSPSRFAHYMELRKQDEHYQSTPMTMGWIYNSLLLKNRLIMPNNNKKIHIPVLIMNAEKDKTVMNRMHKYLARRFHGAKIHTVAHIDHSLYSGTDEIMQEYMDYILRFFSQSS